ncbi:MAG TPA: SCO family protein [Candidatus Binatia bacterium]|nr:SCO family protein [Candidatus Binatia bacterium]
MQRLTWISVFLALVLVGIGAIRFVVHQRRSTHARDLPVLGTVPPFSLVERSGRTISRDDLGGTIWIADFIFTRCTSVCPLLSERMARVAHALRAAGTASTRLVSFSVDPAHDTPPVLADYADRFHADPTQWWFVTGDRAALYALISDGFRLSVAQREGSTNANPNDLITHSDRFVLIDGAFQIRAYYHGTDDDTLVQLIDDVEMLGSTTPKPGR